MSQELLKILLIHDATSGVAEIRRLLSRTELAPFELAHVTTEAAFRGVRRDYYHVCIVDSPLKGMCTLEESRRAGFSAPIIMLTTNTAYNVLNAMGGGAADCLVRETLTAGALEEAICLVRGRDRRKKHKSQCARRYRALVENSGEIIYTHDLQGNLTFLSRAGERLIGHTSEELRNTKILQILSPECRETVWQNILRMLADRKPSAYEAIIVTREGHGIPVAVATHLVYERGRPIEVQGVVRPLSTQSHPSATLTDGGWSSRVILTL